MTGPEFTATITDPAYEGTIPVGEPAIETSTLWSEETRQAHLESLPSYGFSDERLEATIDEIVAIGLPVNNYKSLHLSPNTKGTEYHVGSWGSSRLHSNYGEFTIYERLDQLFPEERIATLAHEGLHAATPHDTENEHLYGGEAERQQVEAYIQKVTDQSLATGIHLDGYHKHLVGQYQRGEINWDLLAEETFAILGEMALTDRNGLQDVQERQQRKVEDLNRINRINGRSEVDFEELVTTDKSTEAVGIDKTLITLIKSVDNVSELRSHTHRMKANIYTAGNYAKVVEREVLRTAYYSPDVVILSLVEAIAEEDRLRKDQEKKRKKMEIHSV